jgi:hypothetical protein
MYRKIKTSSSILTGCRKPLMSRFESWSAQNLLSLQIVAANLDPDVLQWPGGSLISSLLWLCVMTRSLCVLPNQHREIFARAARRVILRWRSYKHRSAIRTA